ncbi:Alpha/beta hydrolase fold-3 domain protein [Cyclobacterium qasimii]|uniref:Alpha/beta hydrolase fold-3 domain protein n=1 Tax=Cyclobacterium qasimii M12-11B TaxID=641524 RepID=S7VF43_9BACT|nr:Alpha/beta hydrolase fold-3 domain protein [Cyclobacterium qasimii]EPR68162.1 Alpha/beta hydrolase fold-3 domain protein [Cyclobacterium qasimii M12-11B]
MNIAKTLVLSVLMFSGISFSIKAQSFEDGKAIIDLIASYAQARESIDTVMLKYIITEDMDQLVSSGEWRHGMKAAVKGMAASSTSNPGDRVLKVERVRYLKEDVALADARYTIKNEDGTDRKMWSTFVTIKRGNSGK